MVVPERDAMTVGRGRCRAEARVRVATLVAIIASTGGCGGGSGFHCPVTTEAPAADQERALDAIGPLSFVCQLTVTRRRGAFRTRTYVSTGTVVSGGFLVTAGHNVYREDRLERVEGYCGTTIAQAGEPTFVFEGEELRRRAFTVRGFGGDFADDYGVLDVGEDTVQGSPWVLSTQASAGQRVRLSGYPGDSVSDGVTLYDTETGLTCVNDEFLSYALETATGNSGGPIWVMEAGAPTLLGIHVTGGGAKRIDADVISLIEAARLARTQTSASRD